MKNIVAGLLSPPSHDLAAFHDVCRRAMILVGLVGGFVFALPLTAPDPHEFHYAAAVRIAVFALAAIAEFGFRHRWSSALLLVGSIVGVGPYLFAAGIGTADTAWVPVIALIGCMAGGTRNGLWWMLAAIGTLVVAAIWGAEPHRGFGFEVYPIGDARAYFAASTAVLTFLTFMSYAVFEYFYKRSINELETANGDLETTVSHLRSALDERDALREQLLETEKVKSLGLMAGGLAHDFNNLLTGIMGELDLAALDAEGNEDVLLSIGHARESAVAASDMTATLLAYAGRRPVERTTLDPVDVADFVRSIAGSATGRAVPIIVDAVETSRRFEGDRAQVEQVFLNLIMNAVQSMDGRPGEVVVAVSDRYLDHTALTRNRALTELEPGSYLVVEVTDAGVGIHEEALARIFEPFFTSRDDGRGLGLASTLGIIRSHNAGIFVDSEVGKGTTFKVAFPAVDKPVREVARISEVSIDATGTVLIVDDRAEVLTAVERLVESLGLRAVARSSAAEAIALFEQAPAHYDVALLDVMMPEMRGDELAQRLLQIRDTLPVVFMSGYVNETEVLTALEGAAFLPKPIRRRDLANVLRKKVREASVEIPVAEYRAYLGLSEESSAAS